MEESDKAVAGGKMNRVNKKASIALLIIAFTVCAHIFAEAEVVYVNSENGLRVRAMPDEKSKVIQVLPFGAKVAVVDDDPGMNGWIRVEGDNYIKAEYTRKTDPFEDMELLGEWRVTAYAETGSPCANGSYPQTGYTIACNSLDFGTEVYIEDVGFRTVEDRGPAWLGDAWLDLYLGDYDACVQWGDQTKKVWRVKE